jgi:hypothetical protein
MTDKIHKELSRAQHAKELLENELIIEAFAKLENGIVDAWKAAPSRDIDGQHKLKLMCNLLQQLKTYLQDIIETGKMAKIQLEDEIKKQSRKKKI